MGSLQRRYSGPGQPFHFSAYTCFLHVSPPTFFFFFVYLCDVQATEVLAKIRDWKKTARVGEHFAVEVSGAVISRAELMRDALELLMAGIGKQRSRLETLAAVSKWRQMCKTRPHSIYT